MNNPFRLSDIPDEARADVERHRISETEETKRKTVAEKEQTRRVALGTDGYHAVRLLVLVVPAVLVIILRASSCEQARVADVEMTERARIAAGILDGGAAR